MWRDRVTSVAAGSVLGSHYSQRPDGARFFFGDSSQHSAALHAGLLSFTPYGSAAAGEEGVFGFMRRVSPGCAGMTGWPCLRGDGRLANWPPLARGMAGWLVGPACAGDGGLASWPRLRGGWPGWRVGSRLRGGWPVGELAPACAGMAGWRVGTSLRTDGEQESCLAAERMPTRRSCHAFPGWRRDYFLGAGRLGLEAGTAS